MLYQAGNQELLIVRAALWMAKLLLSFLQPGWTFPLARARCTAFSKGENMAIAMLVLQIILMVLGLIAKQYGH